ncbi:MAG: hypothetical protein V4622_00480 [Bacteroidota bacterium]
MRKTLTFLLFLTQLNLSFAQEKIPLVFPNDSIFEVNDSVNKLPLVQLKISPISLSTGNYIKFQNEDLSYIINTFDIEGQINYKNYSFDLDFKKSYQKSFSFENDFGLYLYDLTGYFSEFNSNFEYRFKTTKGFGFCKIKNKINPDSKINVRSFKNVLVVKSFKNLSLLAGITQFNYFHPFLLARDYSYSTIIDSADVDYFNFKYFYSSKQTQINIGFRYAILKNVALKTTNAKGYKFTNFSAYAKLNFTITESPTFLIVENALMENKYNSYLTSVNQKQNFIKPSKEELKNVNNIGLGIRIGFDYQFNPNNSMFGWRFGAEFIKNPTYSYLSYTQTYNHEFDRVDGGGGGGSIHNSYFAIKLGMILNSRQWKK